MLEVRRGRERQRYGNESVGTQEHDSCQQNDMGVDEGIQELRFFLSAVSDMAGWQKARFMYKRCKREGFKF